MATNRCISGTNLIFPVTFIKICAQYLFSCTKAKKLQFNFGPNWIWIAHFYQNKFLRKLTVTIVYQLYSFILQHFKKSSKSKSWDKRLHDFGPNWVWFTSLKKIFFTKVDQHCLGLTIVYHHIMSFQKNCHRADHENKVA